MKPYYQDEYVTLYCGDCREIVPTLGKFDLILTDPPYGKVKGDFDEKWTNRNEMLKDCYAWRDMMFLSMTASATLFWFAWPSLAGKIESIISEKLNTISHIVWLKPYSTSQKASPEILRAPIFESERIIMAEHYGSDDIARGEKCFDKECNVFLYAPIRDWLRDNLPVDYNQASLDLNWTTASVRHCFEGGLGFWRMPTQQKYEQIQHTYPQRFNREYQELCKEYENLKRKYEQKRRYFKLENEDQKTEIWRFNPSGNKSGHPTEKPLSLINFMVRIASRQSSNILDPFAGSGTTGVAAKLLNRKCTLIEREEKYCEIAARRLSQGVLPLYETAGKESE